MHGDVDGARMSLVHAKANQWARELIDLDYRNTLVNFKSTKSGSLDLTGCVADTLSRLYGGQRTSLRTLFSDEEALANASKSTRNIRRRITAFREEQGVDIGKLACGLVRTNPQKGGTRPVLALRAPLLLRPIEIQARSAAETEFVLQAGAEVEVNPVLLYALQREYGLEFDPEEVTAKINGIVAELTDTTEQVERVFELLTELSQPNGTALTLEQAVVVGVFNYQKLAMVQDLESATALMAEHDLIAALAGVEGAVDELRSGAASYTPRDIDAIDPADEYLVHDANSSQHRAIDIALAGHHLVIEGPPGTGKSQTIANLIAEAAARGLRVLFVAEKRAAIEAVTDRLADVDLADLVLDLHSGVGSARKRIAEQLAASLNRASQQRPIDASDLHRQLTGRRARLAEYASELHQRRPPWNVSAFQVREELLRIGGSRVTRALPATVLQRLDAHTAAEVADRLVEFVDLGGIRVLGGETPWSKAEVRDAGDARRILTELDELAGSTLRRSQDGIHRLVHQVGLQVPTEIAGWQDVLALLDQVAASVQKFGRDIFGEHLDAMCWATAGGAERRKAGVTLGWSQRRALVKKAKAMCQIGITKKAALHRELAAISEQRTHWQRLGGPQSRPAAVLGLNEVTADYTRLRNQLAAVALSTRIGDLERRPAPQVQQTLDGLLGDRDIVFNLPRIHQLRTWFEQLGLAELLSSIVNRRPTAEEARAMFRHAWLDGLDDEFRFASRALREFNPDGHDRVVAEYQRADVEHRRMAAERVRRRVAVAFRDACNGFPAEETLARKEAEKKARHLPLRRLVERAPHVLFAMRPCWAMSPLLVSQTLPAERLFDIVIFDEASQIKPHDAVTSIMRGERLVVAGDEKQLPPSAWFDRVITIDDDAEGEDSDIADYESILTALRPIVPSECHQRLQWHYRSQDERLIAFSNKEMYAGDLVTFPGARLESPVRLEVVDGTASPGQGGVPAEEVRKVVELIIEHAEQRPHESLGVITLGVKHQARVETALRDALADRRDLDGFFAEDAGPTRRFFVKNIETVQGDEREAIILSVGVARTATGTVSRTAFGALNYRGAERRVNVAVTRARRWMTVVASFPPNALEPSDKVNGTEMLRRYLEAAQMAGDPTAVGRQMDIPLNGFEQDIATRLANRGITAYPQWGVSGYRIDFTLAHPELPGQMVLAVEADGDSYHRMTSTRDRDRLRQQQLERLGWRFHRVWAAAWFANPEAEADKIEAAWRRAVEACDIERDQVTARTEPAISPTTSGNNASSAGQADSPAQQHADRGPRPWLPYGVPIDHFTDRQLIVLFRWLMRDGLPLSREERLRQGLVELGFRKLGPKIRARLEHAADIAQTLTDDEER